MTIPADIATVENAIQAWIVAGSGLAADKVLWSGQGKGRPGEQWISLKFLALPSEGQDWTDVEDAPEPQDGAEIEHRARGQRVATLSIQCYAGNAVGAVSPMMRLERVKLARSLPTAMDAFRAGGVGIRSMSGPTDVSAPRTPGTFEPRAVMSARISLAAELVETGTYIEKAGGAGTVTP